MVPHQQQPRHDLHRRAPQAAGGSQISQSVDINTDGGVATFSGGTATETRLVFDTAALPSQGLRTLLTASAAPTTTSSSPPLDASSTTDSASPSNTGPSGSNGNNNGLPLAGIIAIAVGCALISFIIIVLFVRHIRRNRHIAEQSRKSFAALDMVQHQHQHRGTSGISRNAWKKHSWGGLGSQDHIKVEDVALPPMSPKPPRTSTRDGTDGHDRSDENENDDMAQVVEYSKPTSYQLPSQSPFANPSLAPPATSPRGHAIPESPSIYSVTVSQPVVTNPDNASFLSLTPSRQTAPTPTKEERAVNLRALDNLIAALDSSSNDGANGGNQPDASVWRAALGGGSVGKGAGSAR